MKIDTNIPSLMSSAENRTAKASTATASASSGAVRNSAAGSSLDRASLGMPGTALDNSSDIRHERVAALRNAIQSGTYTVIPSKIADSMMSEHFSRAIAR